MALPGAGSDISLLDLKVEFGGPAIPSLTDYYRDGTYVPNITENLAVPLSGTISLRDFENTTDVTVSLDGASISEAHSDFSWNSIVGIKIDTDGNVYENSGQSTAWTQIDAVTDWIRPVSGSNATYDVRYTSKTGTGTFNFASAAAEDTWISMSADRVWQMRKTTVGTISLSCTFEIRKDGGAVIDGGTYSFSINNTV